MSRSLPIFQELLENYQKQIITNKKIVSKKKLVINPTEELSLNNSKKIIQQQLITAIKAEDLNKVKQLLNFYPKDYFAPFRYNGKLCDFSYIAAEQGKIAICQFLLKNQLSVVPYKSNEVSENNLLKLALEKDNLEIFKLFLTYAQKPNFEYHIVVDEMRDLEKLKNDYNLNTLDAYINHKIACGSLPNKVLEYWLTSLNGKLINLYHFGGNCLLFPMKAQDNVEKVQEFYNMVQKKFPVLSDQLIGASLDKVLRNSKRKELLPIWLKLSKNYLEANQYTLSMESFFGNFSTYETDNFTSFFGALKTNRIPLLSFLDLTGERALYKIFKENVYLKKQADKFTRENPQIAFLGSKNHILKYLKNNDCTIISSTGDNLLHFIFKSNLYKKLDDTFKESVKFIILNKTELVKVQNHQGQTPFEIVSDSNLSNFTSFLEYCIILKEKQSLRPEKVIKKVKLKKIL